MNKTLLLGLCIVLLVIPMAYAVPDGGVSYYNFNDNVEDQWASNDGSVTGMTYSATYPTYNISGDGSTKSGDFDGTDDGVDSSSADLDFTDTLTFSLWVNPDTFDRYERFFQYGVDSGVNRNSITMEYDDREPNNFLYKLRTDLGDYEYKSGSATISTGSWTHIVFSISGDSFTVYLNGVGLSLTSEVSGGSPTVSSLNNNQDFLLGETESDVNHYFDGRIDEFKIFNKTLNSTEIQNLYNYGNIIGVGPSEVSLNLKDYWNNNSINNFTAIVDGTSFNTTDGAINTGHYNNETAVVNITFSADGYFNRTYEHNYSNGSLQGSVGYFKINSTDYWNNNSLSNFTIVIDGTEVTADGTELNWTNSAQGTYDVLVSKSGYFNRTYSNQEVLFNTSLSSILGYFKVFNITDDWNSSTISDYNITLNSNTYASDGEQLNFTNETQGTYDITFSHSDYFNKTIQADVLFNNSLSTNLTYNYARAVVRAFEQPTNNTEISNFTLNITSLNSSYSWYGVTNNSNLTIEMAWNESNFLFIDGNGYAYENTTLYGQNDNDYNFSLWTQNSISINVYNYSSLTLLNQPVDLTFTSTDHNVVYNTSNGTFYKDELPIGFYTLRAESLDFSDAYYYFTINNKSHQFLNIYLFPTGDCSDVTFTVRNVLNDLIEDVILSFNKLINLSWVTVAQKETDFAGVGQVCLDELPYLIYAEHDDYDTWSGEINPIDDEYTIYIEQEGTISFSSFGDIVYSYSPSSIELPSNSTNFSLMVNSQTGVVSSFGLYTNYNGIDYIENVTGSPAGGNAIMEVPLSVAQELFNITFFITDVDDQVMEFQVFYQVFDDTPTNYSLFVLASEYIAEEDTFTITFMTYFMIFIMLLLLMSAGLPLLGLMGSSILFFAIAIFVGLIPTTIGSITILLLIGLTAVINKEGVY